MRLAPILRPIAQAPGIGVVEPGASVIRNTIDDLEMQIRLFDADGDKLSHVAPADPDGESAPVDRRMIHVAYAHAEHLHAVAVGVQTGERLVEDLGYAIAAVGLGIDAVVDGLIAAVEADRVIRSRDQKSVLAGSNRIHEDAPANVAPVNAAGA
ncbi:MAG: hypothetical protein HY527_06755, partial [Betaproteobacteria bacterium]|nr:hypothetical protein [Betaproteobacteria bacterium]